MIGQWNLIRQAQIIALHVVMSVTAIWPACNLIKRWNGVFDVSARLKERKRIRL